MSCVQICSRWQDVGQRASICTASGRAGRPLSPVLTYSASADAHTSTHAGGIANRRNGSRTRGSSTESPSSSTHSSGRAAIRWSPGGRKARGVGSVRLRELLRCPGPCWSAATICCVPCRQRYSVLCCLTTRMKAEEACRGVLRGRDSNSQPSGAGRTQSLPVPFCEIPGRRGDRVTAGDRLRPSIADATRGNRARHLTLSRLTAGPGIHVRPGPATPKLKSRLPLWPEANECPSFSARRTGRLGLEHNHTTRDKCSLRPVPAVHLDVS